MMLRPFPGRYNTSSSARKLSASALITEYSCAPLRGLKLEAAEMLCLFYAPLCYAQKVAFWNDALKVVVFASSLDLAVSSKHAIIQY